MPPRRPKDWFHGDTAERDVLFRGQRWDRDRSIASANENGPGLYFTSSEEEASSYGAYLYLARLRAGFKWMPKKRPTMKFLLELFEAASPDDQELFLENWNATSPREPLSHYVRQDTMHDAALTLYGDLIRDAGEWVAAMRSAGYDGIIVQRAYGRQHLIVWSPEKLNVWQVR